MTKSEAKAIERRGRRAYHVLMGTADKMASSPDDPVLPIGWMSEQNPEINKALTIVRDELYAILEMASAELGNR